MLENLKRQKTLLIILTSIFVILLGIMAFLWFQISNVGKIGDKTGGISLPPQLAEVSNFFVSDFSSESLMPGYELKIKDANTLKEISLRLNLFSQAIGARVFDPTTGENKIVKVNKMKFVLLPSEDEKPLFRWTSAEPSQTEATVSVANEANLLQIKVYLNPVLITQDRLSSMYTQVALLGMYLASQNYQNLTIDELSKRYSEEMVPYLGQDLDKPLFEVVRIQK